MPMWTGADGPGELSDRFTQPDGNQGSQGKIRNRLPEGGDRTGGSMGYMESVTIGNVLMALYFQIAAPICITFSCGYTSCITPMSELRLL